MFQIRYTLEARERLDEIYESDPKSARIIADHIRKLPQTYRNDPLLKGPLSEGLRRNRIGRYRAIYRVLEKQKEIRIIMIDLRRLVYG